MNDSELNIQEIPCTPYADQRPGTAGLRKKTAVFQQQHYLETFVHAILTKAQFPKNATLVLGGDGRYFNLHAIQVIARMAAAYDVDHLIIGQNGILSTPAASNLIRQRGCDGGIILTASHNPGGPDGDFGIKFNTAAGGQAPEHLTNSVYEGSKAISSYRMADLPEFDLSRTGKQVVKGFIVEIVDPVADYTAIMEQLFDFDLMAKFIADGGKVVFDALHGVTGPYAHRILQDLLGASPGSILHGKPLPDFGGLHPDPNPVDAEHLARLAFSDHAPDLIAASDADGDRNMILGPGLLVSPGDSVAIMLANAGHIPGYAHGISGVARSMPTSRALDKVAASLDIPCFETPTGWRFFCNLLEAGQIGLCGEESFGTGSSHAREKDGLWAVLFWLNLLASLRKPLPEIVMDHWRVFGRHYYQREDYFIADSDGANNLVTNLRGKIAGLVGSMQDGRRIETADDFRYVDPIDHSVSDHQGIRINLDNGGRIIFRLSGTGTTGATLRVYLEQYVDDGQKLNDPAATVLRPLGRLAANIAEIKRFGGPATPTAVV
jgi:phosphoglucomutase